MSSVSCAEGVVYEQFSERSELSCERLFVVSLFLAVSRVLKKHDVSVLHRIYCSLDAVVYDYIGLCELDLCAQKLRKSVRNRSQSEFLLRLALRSSHVAHEDDLRAVIFKIFYSRQSGSDTDIIRDLSVLHRYIEVASYQRLLSLYINIFYSLFHFSIPLTYITCARQVPSFEKTARHAFMVGLPGMLVIVLLFYSASTAAMCLASIRSLLE